MATLTPTSVTTSAINSASSHASSIDNPHDVTAEQAGALSTGNIAIVLNATDVALTPAQFSNNSFDLTGTLTANVSIIIPDGVAQSFIMDNLTTGAFTVTVKHSLSLGVVIVQGISQILYTTGTVVEIVTAASTAHTHVAADTTDFQAVVSANANVIANNAKVSDVNHVAALLPNVDNTSDATKNAVVATLTNKTLTAPLATADATAALGLVTKQQAEAIAIEMAIALGA